MIVARHTRLLRFAAIVAIAALGLMVWSLLQPRPIPVILAMSLGQALGTASFLAFLYVVLADYRSTPPKDPPKPTDRTP